MKCEKCHKLLQCECWEPTITPLHEPAATGEEVVGAQRVVRELAERWERRIAVMKARPDCDTHWIKGLVGAHEDCLEDLRTEMGKLPNAPLQRPDSTTRASDTK